MRFVGGVLCTDKTARAPTRTTGIRLRYYDAGTGEGNCMHQILGDDGVMARVIESN